MRIIAVNCEMGQWSSFGKCVYNRGTCGTGQMMHTRAVIKQCAHGGDCSCRKEEVGVDCSKPCRKINITYTYILKNM